MATDLSVIGLPLILSPFLPMRGLMKMAETLLGLPKAVIILATYCRSEPFGTSTSSSSIEKTEPLFESMSWICSVLSGKVMCAHETPSRLYSSCCFLISASMKCDCSRSLVKLMQSCSKVLNSKFSKPKMSRKPMKRRSLSGTLLPSRVTLSFLMTQSNIAE